jgi:hypothetical protein
MNFSLTKHNFFGGDVMTFDKAMRILDPEYQLQSETFSDVEEACRFAIRAMAILKNLPEYSWLESDDEIQSN